MTDNEAARILSDTNSMTNISATEYITALTRAVVALHTVATLKEVFSISDDILKENKDV